LDDDPAVRRLLRLVSTGLAALIATTFPLFTPDHPWPQIPWIAAARHLPFWWDWLALGVLAAGTCLQFDPKSRYTAVAPGIQAVGLAAALVVDQHRLQPWAYEYLLVTALLALAPNQRGMRCVRWLVLSVYVHSALSKLDAAYLETNGRQLLDALLQSVGIQHQGWNQPGPQFACLAFPIGEFAIVAALVVPRTRRIGLCGSILMHALLIWTLGPFGLRHEPGVLIWNGVFIVQNVILFGRLPTTAEPGMPGCHAPIRDRLAQTIAVASVALPFLEPLGCWDHWPSWAVYSSRPALVTLLVEESSVARLPPGLQQHAGPAEPLSTWCPVSLDQWSLQQLHCPIYPQERFRVAAALTIAEQASLGEHVMLRIQSSPDRFTGQRESIQLQGTDAIRNDTAHYWINSSARN
jgi:hypothetical protein